MAEAEKAQSKAAADAMDAAAAVAADPQAQALIEGGARHWAKGGHNRVYLTEDQTLALYGITGTKGAYKDAAGDKVSNSRAYKATAASVYYDVDLKKMVGKADL